MHIKNHIKTVRRSLVLAMMAGVVPAMAATHNATTVDGISISGYIDPTYIYNQDAQVSSFFFADRNAPYYYYHSTFGARHLAHLRDARIDRAHALCDTARLLRLCHLLGARRPTPADPLTPQASWWADAHP